METKDFSILLTNDDGIHSPGLWAAADVLAEIGTLWIAAPINEHSRAENPSGESSGKIRPWSREGNYKVFVVEGPPVRCIHLGLLEMLPRRPDLVVSGINLSSNVGIDITRSGTIGAAIEAADSGIPSLTVSLETKFNRTAYLPENRDYEVPAFFCSLFAGVMLGNKLWEDVQSLKVEIPGNAVHSTPWEITGLSKKSLYKIKNQEGPDLANTDKTEEHAPPDFSAFHEGTDAHTVLVKEHVAVTPLSLDMTSAIDFFKLRKIIERRIR